MERRTISISNKRQITIPQRFYEQLGFDGEAECLVRGSELILRPVSRKGGGEFAEQILADLITQGYAGEELLERFRTEQQKIRPAVEKMILEADALAKSGCPSPSIDDVFGAED